VSTRVRKLGTATRIEWWSDGCEPNFQLEAVVVQPRAVGGVTIVHEHCGESEWQWPRITLNETDARALAAALLAEVQ
jgi:hypothetical protein